MSAFHGACDSPFATPASARDGGHAHAPLASVPSFASDRTTEASTWDAMDTYFECITTCSLEDGECITRCVEELRDHA